MYRSSRTDMFVFQKNKPGEIVIMNHRGRKRVVECVRTRDLVVRGSFRLQIQDQCLTRTQKPQTHLISSQNCPRIDLNISC